MVIAYDTRAIIDDTIAFVNKHKNHDIRYSITKAICNISCLQCLSGKAK